MTTEKDKPHTLTSEPHEKKAGADKVKVEEPEIKMPGLKELDEESEKLGRPIHLDIDLATGKVKKVPQEKPE